MATKWTVKKVVDGTAEAPLYAIYDDKDNPIGGAATEHDAMLMAHAPVLWNALADMFDAHPETTGGRTVLNGYVLELLRKTGPK